MFKVVNGSEIRHDIAQLLSKTVHDFLKLKNNDDCMTTMVKMFATESALFEVMLRNRRAIEDCFNISDGDMKELFKTLNENSFEINQVYVNKLWDYKENLK